MPYIKKENRSLYNEILENTVNEILLDKADDIILISSSFKSYVYELISTFIGRFRYYDSLITDIKKDSDLLHQVGDLNYCITYVYWKLLGDNASYGKRVLLQSKIIDMLRISVNWFDNSDEYDPGHVRLEMARSVLNDVLNETYRRKTAIYEDQKIQENGDVFE
jgi:hypothetical protein